jgi:F0F1-type ATP synthase assembly protein I
MDPKNQSNWSTYAIVSGFVFETLLILALGFSAGYFLDQWWNTEVIFTILLMVLSVFYSVYRLIRRVNNSGDQDGTK